MAAPSFSSTLTAARLRAALILAALAIPAPILANGIVRDSIGAVSSGRGGANIAHSDNLSVIHDNPAGMSWIDGKLRFELSNDFLWRDVYYRDPDDADDANDRTFYLPEVAFAARIPDTPVTLGLGLFIPGGYGAKYDLEHSLFGESTYRSEGMLLKVLPSVAVQLGPYVSVAGSVGLSYSKTQFRAPYTFQTGPFAGQSARVDLDTDAYGVTGSFGIQVRPTDRFVIGASYISQSLTHQDGDFDLNITGTPLAGLVTDPTATYDAEFNMRWPRLAALGASYRFERARFSVDGVWYDWSSAFDQFRFKLDDGDNPEFDALAGTVVRETLPLDWRDTFSIRVGYEFFISESSILRLGYIYNLNPIPSSTMTPLLPGTLEHTIAIGYGHHFGPWEVHVAYQYAWAQDQRVRSSTLAGDDFSSSELSAEAHWAMLTLGGRF